MFDKVDHPNLSEAQFSVASEMMRRLRDIPKMRPNVRSDELMMSVVACCREFAQAADHESWSYLQEASSAVERLKNRVDPTFELDTRHAAQAFLQLVRERQQAIMAVQHREAATSDMFVLIKCLMMYNSGFDGETALRERMRQACRLYERLLAEPGAPFPDVPGRAPD